MAYTITNSDGSPLATIADGAIDTTTTSLALPGPNFVGYGQFLNQNLVNLLENFASNTAPFSASQPGQLWFDKAHQVLNVFTDSGYTPVSGIVIDNVQPIGGVHTGTIWYNTTTGQMYIYTPNNEFQLIGPLYTTTQGISGAIPTVIDDAGVAGLQHNVVKLQFGNVTIGTFSNDSTFSPQPAIPGFPFINPGLTINETLVSGMTQFYANANVAAYLPLDPTIIGIQSSVVSSNTAVVGYVDTQVATIYGVIDAVNLAVNTASTNAQFLAVNNAIIANTAAAITYANILNDAMVANITAANLEIANNWSNVSTIQLQVISINASIATVQSEITSINSNITAANANISSTWTNVSTLQSQVTSINANVLAANAAIATNSANVLAANAAIAINSANIVTLQSDIIAVNSNVTAANAAIATLQTQVYTNANVAAYLPTYSGNILANAVTVSTINVDGGVRINGNLLFATAVPTISSGFGTNASIIAHNGSTVFSANIGLGNIATSGVFGMPAASNGWIAHVQVFNPTAAGAMQTTLVNASSNVSVTVTNYWTANGAITAWPENTTLTVMAAAY